MKTLREFLPAALATALLVALAPAALAEKADKDKPTHIEANRMSADDTRRLSIFEGNVVLTKGTIIIRADRIVVRQDPEGYQFATATGAPVRFRQKAEPKGDKEGVWMDGGALRIEVDDRNEKIELFERAWVKRDEDEVRGDYIFVDQRSEFFSAMSSKGGPSPGSDGRVRAVIQPKNKPEDAPGASPKPAAIPAPPAPATKK
jgi:lipopolysaccharide export system protein LptA